MPEQNMFVDTLQYPMSSAITVRNMHCSAVEFRQFSQGERNSQNLITHQMLFLFVPPGEDSLTFTKW